MPLTVIAFVPAGVILPNLAKLSAVRDVCYFWLLRRNAWASAAIFSIYLSSLLSALLLDVMLIRPLLDPEMNSFDDADGA